MWLFFWGVRLTPEFSKGARLISRALLRLKGVTQFLWHVSKSSIAANSKWRIIIILRDGRTHEFMIGGVSYLLNQGLASVVSYNRLWASVDLRHLYIVNCGLCGHTLISFSVYNALLALYIVFRHRFYLSIIEFLVWQIFVMVWIHMLLKRNRVNFTAFVSVSAYGLRLVGSRSRNAQFVCLWILGASLLGYLVDFVVVEALLRIVCQGSIVRRWVIICECWCRWTYRQTIVAFSCFLILLLCSQMKLKVFFTKEVWITTFVQNERSFFARWSTPSFLVWWLFLLGGWPYGIFLWKSLLQLSIE